MRENMKLQSRKDSSLPGLCFQIYSTRESVGYKTIKDSVKEVREIQKRIKGKEGYLMDYFTEKVKCNHFLFLFVQNFRQ